MAENQGFPIFDQPFVDGKSFRITEGWRQFLVNLWRRTGGSSGSVAFNAGDTKVSASTTIPDGWLLCDGSAVSRSVYSALFAALGTTWGPGDGVTTFNIPDFRGRALYGATMIAPVGTVGGSEYATILEANLPAHRHTITDPGHLHAITDPGHTHAVNDPGHDHTAMAPDVSSAGVNPGGAVAGNTGSSATGITIDPATTGVTVDTATTGITETNDTGSNDPLLIQNPFAAINWLIKT